VTCFFVLFLSLYHNCDSTRYDYTTRRYHDAFDYDGSDRNYDMRSIRLRYDYDTTTTKNWHVHFCLHRVGLGSHFIVISSYYHCIVRSWAITKGLDNVILHPCIVSLCNLYSISDLFATFDCQGLFQFHRVYLHGSQSVSNIITFNVQRNVRVWYAHFIFWNVRTLCVYISVRVYGSNYQGRFWH